MHGKTVHTDGLHTGTTTKKAKQEREITYILKPYRRRSRS
nr:MAG TPA: hypothetical protein [Caudoviricetes sp.]